MRTVVAAALAALVVHAADKPEWPDFRGPGGQGHAAPSALPVEWSESRHVAWKVPVPGTGWSSPVVGGGRVWLTTAVGGRELSLRAMAFDLETGREAVNAEVFRLRTARSLNPKNNMASPSPVLDGERVYVHFGAEGTAALTTAGEIVWTARFAYDAQHGPGGSPILHDDLLVFSGDGYDDAFVVALDTRTGKTRWKTGRRRPFSQAYTTPLVINAGNRDQIVSVGAFRTAAYDPANGAEIWRVGYGDGFSNVPRPVFAHGLVYITTGFHQPALMAVRPDGTGDVTGTHVAWTLQRGVPFTPSPVVVGNELYMVNDGGILTCVNAKTGTVHWQQRLGGSFSASPLFADGRLYFPGEDGTTHVVAPGATFRKLAENRLDGSLLASMAVAGQSFLIRTDRHLYKIANAAQK